MLSLKPPMISIDASSSYAKLDDVCSKTLAASASFNTSSLSCRPGVTGGDGIGRRTSTSVDVVDVASVYNDGVLVVDTIEIML